MDHPPGYIRYILPEVPEEGGDTVGAGAPVLVLVLVGRVQEADHVRHGGSGGLLLVAFRPWRPARTDQGGVGSFRKNARHNQLASSWMWSSVAGGSSLRGIGTDPYAELLDIYELVRSQQFPLASVYAYSSTLVLLFTYYLLASRNSHMNACSKK